MLNNRVVNACINDYMEKDVRPKELETSLANYTEVVNKLKECLPQNKHSLLKDLEKAVISLEILQQEEYFAAGFDYGLSILK